MDELSKELFKDERKEVIKQFGHLPKSIKWLLFIIYTAGVFAGGVKIGNLNLHFNVFAPKGGTSVNVEGAKTVNVNTQPSSCPAKFCSDFKDGSWKYKDRFIPIQDDPLILKSPHSSALPGATMFYDNDIGSFTSETFITPEATISANLVVAYGHFIRCIIGDGDYTKVSCQINEAYPKEVESWSYLDKDGQLHGRNLQYQSSPFSSNKELQIQFGIQKIKDVTIITIKLNDQVPLEWRLPKSLEGKTQIEKVGVGLFTTNYDDVQAIFKQFQLDPHL